MRFCLFLVDEGAITEAQCVHVLRLVCQRTPPLGRLIVKTKILTMAQLRSLIERQSQQGGALGHLAMAEGLLSADQVAQLVDLQRAETPDPKTILADLGYVTPDRLGQLHKKFVAIVS